ncbi:Uu.00g075870.m01.CDS01 [Anthostomella pinea]|uniref:Uu.00g075870.m01.CDS01 n=1 Tax=Anthostomella pinea TaxID=933095 RepID=A0AAI8VVQ1_9PEZI|nr:Uu.00g075870.m01.CDS01 [Anthostomella pinea]
MQDRKQHPAKRLHHHLRPRPPGSGKGTLCKRITETPDLSSHGFRHLSVGDCLRELAGLEALCEAQSFDHERILESVTKNKLLPSEVLIPVLEHKIASTTPSGDSGATAWLIDGFPRSLETALTFEEKIGRPVRIVTLECARENARSRFLNRGREKADDRERFDRRFDEYVVNMEAIREHYGGITDAISVDGTREECFEEFVHLLTAKPKDG